MRLLLICLAAVCSHALVAPTLAARQVSVSSSPAMMAKIPPKRVPAALARAAPKKAAAKVVAKAKTAVKAVAKKTPLKSSSPKGKGGIFPWVTNEPGTYAEVPKLADIQIRAMEKWVGGGANSITSNAFSVSKFLYPKNTRK